MRIPATAALSCAFVLAFTSPAAAYPNNVSAAKTYLRGLFSCLDSTWGFQAR
ncbi:MAG: hypothetical protein HOV86_30295 [Thermoactinospora sp.]|nr:hypothetical protein [Thermoactinospora sp.]